MSVTLSVPWATPCGIEVRATGKHYDGILSNVKAKKVSQSPKNRTCDNLAAPILVDTIRIRIYDRKQQHSSNVFLCICRTVFLRLYKKCENRKRICLIEYKGKQVDKRKSLLKSPAT